MENGDKNKSVAFIILVSVYIIKYSLTGYFIRCALLVPGLDPFLPSELP